MKYFIFIALLLGLTACEPSVLFEQPMPPGTDNLSTFPKNVQGSYYLTSDSTLVTVTNKTIIIDNQVHYKRAVNDLAQPANCKIVDGSVYIKTTKECLPYHEIKNDTLFATIHRLDTLFQFGEYHIAKLYDDKFFLNYSDMEGHWLLSIITPIEDRSFVWQFVQIASDEDYSQISKKHYSYMREDSVEIDILDPTLEEFNAILASNYVEINDTLIPINTKFSFNYEK